MGNVIRDLTEGNDLHDEIVILACRNYLCSYIGLERDFKFNPSIRNTTRMMILTQCPKCGNMGCESYGRIYRKDYLKGEMRQWRWKRKYYNYRENKLREENR